MCAPRVPPAFPPETSTILEDRPTSARSGKGDGGWNRLSKSRCVVLGVVRARVHADATLRDARQRECPSDVDLTIVEKCWFDE